MRGSTVAVFFLVVVIASVCLAAPAKEKELTKKGKKLSTKDDSKTNKLSLKKKTTITETKPMSLREPRSFGYVGQPGDVGVPNPRPATEGYWPKYRIVRRGRDDDEDDDVEESDEDQDEDDIQDDEGGASDEDDDEVSFDTPDWNVLFPKEESGPYDYAWRKYPASTSGGDVKEKPLLIGTRGDGTSYALAPGSPGAAPRGRTTYVQRRRPSWGKVEWAGRRSGSGRPMRRRQPVMWAVKKAPKSSEEDSPWTQSPIFMSERPSRRTPQGPIYYKSQYVPSSNRRNWNWRPVPVRRQAWDSDESAESVEEPSSRPPVKVVWARQQRRSRPTSPVTMKRSRNWGRQPWAWGESWN